MENSLRELWSLFNFVQPGLLGPLNYFETQYCKEIIKGGFRRASLAEREASNKLTK